MIGQNDNINLEINDKKSIILRLFGNFYVLIVIILIVIGTIYTNNLGNFSINKIIPNPFAKDTSTIVTELNVEKGSVSAPVDVKKFSISTPDLIAKGKSLFETNCVSCHGADGKGDGIAAASLNPKPRNFTELSGWKNGPKLVQIYKTLQEGIPGSAMASFSSIPPEDRFALIHYIQSFNKDYPKSSDAEISELDKAYSLSAGIKLPNQIPVSLASEKVILDNKTVEDKVNSISLIIAKDSSNGAILFKSLSNNIQKSVRTLLSNNRWNENEGEFVNFIGTENIYNGFNSKIFGLNPQETTSVFQYVKNLFANYKS